MAPISSTGFFSRKEINGRSSRGISPASILSFRTPNLENNLEILISKSANTFFTEKLAGGEREDIIASS